MNPYEAPQTVSNLPKRVFWCTVIIALWCISGAIAGFGLGLLVYRLAPGFQLFQQSPDWQVASVFAVVAVAITMPMGVRRTAKLNSRLHEIYARRQELQAEMQRRRSE